MDVKLRYRYHIESGFFLQNAGKTLKYETLIAGGGMYVISAELWLGPAKNEFQAQEHVCSGTLNQNYTI
jgi:hypothetical protein